MLSRAVLIARKLPFFYLNPEGFKVERGFVKTFGLLDVFIADPVSTPPKSFVMKEQCRQKCRPRNVGAFSDRVPPLPIPNRVVKPISADGTGVDAPGE